MLVTNCAILGALTAVKIHLVVIAPRCLGTPGSLEGERIFVTLGQFHCANMLMNTSRINLWFFFLKNIS